jgi:ankyrin repeat protein
MSALLKESLLIAAENGHIDVVSLLLNNKANVNDKNPNGSTALTLAAENGHSEIVSILLANGANVNDKDSNGCSAMKLVPIRYKSIAMILLNHGGLYRDLCDELQRDGDVKVS